MRYILQFHYDDLLSETKTRLEQLNSRACKEPNKRKMKNALVNASICREGTERGASARIVKTCPPVLRHLVNYNQKKFAESGMHGEPAIFVEARLGAELYGRSDLI